MRDLYARRSCNGYDFLDDFLVNSLRGAALVAESIKSGCRAKCESLVMRLFKPHLKHNTHTHIHTYIYIYT